MDALAKRAALRRGLGGCIAALAWLAILLQWVLATASLANFLSYFTILSNLAVALSLTFALGWPTAAPGRYFARVPVQTAIALYIFIVGLVYNTVLRGLLTLAGWSLVADTMLHVVVPALYVLYWLLCVPPGHLAWRQVGAWLALPALYLAYSLLRGPVAQWYPYPFLDAPRLGYPRVFANAALVLACFLLAGLALVALDRGLKTRGLGQ